MSTSIDTSEPPPDDGARLDLEAEMRNAAMVARYDPQLGVGSNHPPDGIELDTGRLVLVKAPVYLRGSKQGQRLWDGNGDAEQSVRNEAAGWEAAKLLDLDAMVPVAVMRVVPTSSGDEMEVVLIERVIGGIDTGPLTDISDDEIRKAAAFDYAIGQPDRRGRNWMIVRDDQGQAHLLLIDHELCFDLDLSFVDGELKYPAGTVRSSMIDECGRRGIEPEYAILIPLLDETARKALEDLLDDDQLEQLIQRVRAALKESPEAGDPSAN